MYKDRFREMRERNPSLAADDIPRVVTIDSSQGDESFIVFFDASLQHRDKWEIGKCESKKHILSHKYIDHSQGSWTTRIDSMLQSQEPKESSG
jgi:hypothetical protein